MLSAASQIQVAPLTRVFKALADETRLRIVALLCHGELCVCHVESALGLSQSNASRQLGILRTAGVVEHRRDGTWVYYQLAAHTDATVKRVLRELVREFAAATVVRQDLERLCKVKGPNACR